MKYMTIRTPLGLAAAIKQKRRELGWSQARLADVIGTQRQWVLKLEAGNGGAEMGRVLKALQALGLTIKVGDEPLHDKPASDLDAVFRKLRSGRP